MPTFKTLLIGTALFIQCLYTATAVPRHRSEGQPIDGEAQGDVQAFQKLLDQVDPTALHSALQRHSPTPFRDGIFKEDRTAAEALHKDNPPLATSIVALAKRQEPGNSSTVVVITSVNTVTAVDTTVTQSINPSTVAPNPVQPTGQSTVPATQSALPGPSSSPLASSSTPIVVGPSSTPPGGTIVVGGTTTVGGSTVTATAGSTQPGGPIITSGVSPASTLASGQIVTTTDADGVTIVSTIDGGFVTLSGQSGTPGTSVSRSSAVSGPSAAGPGSETSVVLRTTTLPNGAPSTVTDLTIVRGTATGVVTPTGTAGVAGGSQTTTGSPGLQTNLSPRSRSWGWEVVGALGGAVGFAMVL